MTYKNLETAKELSQELERRALALAMQLVNVRPKDPVNGEWIKLAIGIIDANKAIHKLMEGK